MVEQERELRQTKIYELIVYNPKNIGYLKISNDIRYRPKTEEEWIERFNFIIDITPDEVVYMPITEVSNINNDFELMYTENIVNTLPPEPVEFNLTLGFVSKAEERIVKDVILHRIYAIKKMYLDSDKTAYFKKVRIKSFDNIRNPHINGGTMNVSFFSIGRWISPMTRIEVGKDGFFKRDLRDRLYMNIEPLVVSGGGITLTGKTDNGEILTVKSTGKTIIKYRVSAIDDSLNGYKKDISFAGKPTPESLTLNTLMQSETYPTNSFTFKADQLGLVYSILNDCSEIRINSGNSDSLTTEVCSYRERSFF